MNLSIQKQTTKTKTLDCMIRLLLVVALSFGVLLSGLVKSGFAFAWGETMDIRGDGASAVIDIYTDETKVKTYRELTFRGSDGSEAFCMKHGKIFKAGTFTSSNPLDHIKYETLNKIVCAKQKIVFGDMKPTNNYTYNYTLAQTVIWNILKYDEGLAPQNQGYEAPETGVHAGTLYFSYIDWYNKEGWKWEPVNAKYWSNGANNQPVLTAKGIQLRVGNLEIVKTSANTSITDGNSCYSLEGAVYQLKQGSEVKATLTTNADGWARVENIPQGDYDLVEVTAPKGYALNGGSMPVHINGGETTYKNGNADGSVLRDTPQNDPVGILLGKYDGQRTYNGEGNLPQGSATLQGAEFTVKYYDGQYSSVDELNARNPLRTWVYATNSNGAVRPNHDLPISGDNVYRDEAGGITFPLGTYLIYERKAPVGYLINEEKFIRNVTSNDSNLEHVNTYNTPTIKETVKRGDIAFQKKTGIGGKPLSVAFKMTSLTTGESHIIMTDVNGMWSSANSWVAHSTNTNGNDSAVSEDGTVDESKLSSEVGTWFGVDTAVNDDMRALPYDTYHFEELRTSVNKDYELVSFDIVVSVNDRELNIGTVDDELIPVVTVAKEDSETKEYIKGAELVLEMKDDEGNWIEIARTVTEGRIWEVKVQDNREYRLSEVREPKNYQPTEAIEFYIPNQQKKTFVKMIDEPIHVSTEVDVRQSRITLTDYGKSANYFYTMDFRSTSNTWADEFSVSNVFNASINNYAYLDYLITPVTVGDYDNWVNVWYKTNKTDPTFTGDSEKYNACKYNPYNKHNPTNERLKDYTGYRLWKFGVSTRIAEKLEVSSLNLEDGEYITEIAFEYGRVEKGFTTRSDETSLKWDRQKHYALDDFVEVGDIDMTTGDKRGDVDTQAELPSIESQRVPKSAVFSMSVDPSTINANNIVFDDEVACDIHRNYADDYAQLNDDDKDKVEQIMPTVSTYAVDKEDNDKVIVPNLKNVVMDNIVYANLEVGKTYTIKSQIVNKSDNTVLANAEVEFTPDEGASSGYVDVDIAFNGLELNLENDQELVVYERIFEGDRLVALHEDIDDENQTVKVSVPQTPPSEKSDLPTTGDEWLLYLFAFGVIALSVTALIVSRKKE